MSFQDSPSLEYYKDGYQEPPKPEKKNKRTWILLGAVIAMSILLFAVLLRQNKLAGSGTITGYAVDEGDNPIQVEVLIFGTNDIVLSELDGYFRVDGVPAGSQSIIVAYGGIATEVEAVVRAKSEVDLGKIVVPTSLEYMLDE